MVYAQKSPHMLSSPTDSLISLCNRLWLPSLQRLDIHTTGTLCFHNNIHAQLALRLLAQYAPLQLLSLHGAGRDDKGGGVKPTSIVKCHMQEHQHPNGTTQLRTTTHTGMTSHDLISLCTCLTQALVQPNPALSTSLTSLHIGPLTPQHHTNPTQHHATPHDWDPLAVGALCSALGHWPTLQVLRVHGAAQATLETLQTAWSTRSGKHVDLGLQGDAATLTVLSDIGYDCVLGMCACHMHIICTPSCTYCIQRTCRAEQWPTSHVLPSDTIVRSRQQQRLAPEQADVSRCAAPSHQGGGHPPEGAHEAEINSQPRDPVVVGGGGHGGGVRQGVEVGAAGGVWHPLREEQQEQRALAAAEAVGGDDEREGGDGRGNARRRRMRQVW